MKSTLQPSVGNLLKGKTGDVGTLAGVFDETAKLNPPDLANVPEKQKLWQLQEATEKAQGHLVAMLEDLRKVKEVCIIEQISSEERERP